MNQPVAKDTRFSEQYCILQVLLWNSCLLMQYFIVLNYLELVFSGSCFRVRPLLCLTVIKFWCCPEVKRFLCVNEIAFKAPLQFSVSEFISQFLSILVAVSDLAVEKLSSLFKCSHIFAWLDRDWTRDLFGYKTSSVTIWLWCFLPACMHVLFESHLMKLLHISVISLCSVG